MAERLARVEPILALVVRDLGWRPSIPPPPTSTCCSPNPSE